jgi:hypothetical protein
MQKWKGRLEGLLDCWNLNSSVKEVREKCHECRISEGRLVWSEERGMLGQLAAVSR